MIAPVAILGGTFNPPHQGHIQGALSALDQLGVERLGLMPCKIPPHKTTAMVSDHHRVAMVRLACQQSPRLYPELIELDLPAPSYSVKTLRALRQQYPGRPLLFVIGEDSLNTLDSWYEWQSLLSLCHLVVMRRQDPGRGLTPAMQKWLLEHRSHDPDQFTTSRFGHIFLARTAYHAASSTAIRNAASANNDNADVAEQWLMPSIINYIKQHNLYANTK